MKTQNIFNVEGGGFCFLKIESLRISSLLYYLKFPSHAPKTPTEKMFKPITTKKKKEFFYFCQLTIDNWHVSNIK